MVSPRGGAHADSYAGSRSEEPIAAVEDYIADIKGIDPEQAAMLEGIRVDSIKGSAPQRYPASSRVARGNLTPGLPRNRT